MYRFMILYLSTYNWNNINLLRETPTEIRHWKITGKIQLFNIISIIRGWAIKTSFFVTIKMVQDNYKFK